MTYCTLQSYLFAQEMLHYLFNLDPDRQQIVSGIKDMISKAVDQTRLPYARFSQQQQLNCNRWYVFILTQLIRHISLT